MKTKLKSIQQWSKKPCKYHLKTNNILTKCEAKTLSSKNYLIL